MKFCTRPLLLLLLMLVAMQQLDATLSKADKKKKKAAAADYSAQPTESLVTERGLVTRSPSYKDILYNHLAYSKPHAKTKQFPSASLAYVTPWNSRGYDHAKTFGAKFTFVSPVWLQLRPASSETGFTVTGGHDIDQGWMSAVKSSGKVSIVPRVIFEGWTSQDFHRLFSNQYVASGCSETLAQFLVQHKFDGAVLEVWSMLGGNLKQQLAHFVQHVARDLHAVGKLLLLVIPPPVVNNQQSAVFGKEQFDALSSDVDYFSLMTYDFGQNAGAQQAAPNAPLAWVRACVQALAPDAGSALRAKILLGLNFYGYDYVPGAAQPLLGHQYLAILKKHRPAVVWSDEYKEHFLEYSTGIGTHVVAFPTLASLHERIALAKELGTGLSIWEIGQGLDYFFDLL